MSVVWTRVEVVDTERKIQTHKGLRGFALGCWVRETKESMMTPTFLF